MPGNRFSFVFDGLEDVSYPSYQAEKAIRSYSPGNRPNAFSFLKGIYLESRTPGTYRDLVFRLESDLPGFSFKPVRLSRLSLGEKAIIDAFSYSLDEEALYRLAEPRKVSLKAVLYSGETAIASHDAAIEAMPIEHALGSGAEKVLLASYVTPDEALLENAFERAKKLGRERKASFEGYLERDPNDVLLVSEALYESLLEEKIELLRLPSGKGRALESVSLPGSTLLCKKGTSLDIALVYASLVEKAGLHPSIILYEGGAAVGVWLDEESFQSAYQDNAAGLLVMASKGYDRLLVIDPSSGLAPQEAREKAYKDLEEGRLFVGSIDVFAARKEHIVPLPTPDAKGTLSFPSFETESSGKMAAIDENSHRYIDSEDRGDKNRYDHWLDKLLDLNLKNRLINLRPGRNTPQLLVSEAEAFLDLLKGNRKLVVAPYESFVTKERKGEHLLDFPSSYFGKIAKESYEKGIVPFLLSGAEATDDVIKSLSRRSNTALEESGSNPLFLTVGLLRYFDNEKAAEKMKGAMYAPILLLPIKIPLRKGGAHFSFEYEYDEITVNTTLFEYLNQAYGIDLTPIEGTIRKKDGQVDLRLIYNYIRGKIASKKGFALIENASTIGLFSFAHFVMWDDLRRRKEDLLANPHIASMVSGKISFSEPSGLLSSKELDEKEELLPLPLPADSSQIKAIDDALKGASFVMDGPPGTGKSQTIANMIVAFLAKGKRVLFVAEKEVALEVVKRRLDEISLGRFALFLSSSRTAKGDVLKALGELIGLGQLSSSSKFDEAAASLKEKTRELNSLLESLHGPSSFLFSVSEAIDVYLDTIDSKGLFRFPIDRARRLDRGLYEKAVASLERLFRSDEKVGGHLSSPFLPFVGSSYSQLSRDALLKDLKPLVDLDQDLYLAEHNALLGFNGIPKTRQNAILLRDISLIDEQSGGIFASYCAKESDEREESRIRSCLKDVEAYGAARRKILSRFKEDVYSLQREAVLSFMKEYREGGFFASRKARKSLIALLSPHYLGVGKPSKKELDAFLDAYSGSASSKGDVEGELSFLREKLGPIDPGDLEGLSRRFEATLKAKGKARELIASSSSPKKDMNRLASLPGAFSSEAIRRLSTLLGDYLRLSGELLSDHAFDLNLYKDGDEYFKKEKAKVSACLASSGEMASYFAYLEAKSEAASLAGSEIVSLFEEGKIPPRKLVGAYKNGLALLVASEEASAKGVSTLSHDEVERLLVDYASALKSYQEASIAECAAAITSRYPSPEAGSAASSDLYRMRKLIANNGRGVSLRNLLKEFGGLVSTLCPCYLMSPLSVAQFLRKEDRFDVVIFDEASQIPTSEAIGAISHAEQIVVAGDQMQMPPTDFFKATVTGVEEGIDSFLSLDEDLESLLDDVIVMGYPRNRLNFHYRSRNENLIAFSNERFYGNSLYTFPSPMKKGTGVSFVRVKGEYQVGRGINRPEAAALVEEVVRRLSDPLEKKRSIGIVTFNEAQQNLILDLLERKCPSAFLYEEGREPIFVKNLENVQGDERDVILFSTTYGPTKGGSLSINFGPLSREKGERRLNVAITRAREEMVVFSSFDPEDIRAERAKNAGARYLRDFLFFARDGEKALYKVAGSVRYENVGKVASSLAGDLRKLGYEVDLDIGTSLFRVDVAVKGKNGEYVLGILLDGASYLSAPTCEDRNLVQPSILARLGWRFVRFYCIEYFDRPDEVVKEIVNLINAPIPASEGEKKGLTLPSYERKAINLEPNQTPYRKVDLSLAGESDEEKVLLFAQKAIATEAPIAHSLLEKRVKEAFALKSMTSKFRSYLGMAIEKISPARESFPNEETFYYPSGSDPQAYRFYRLEVAKAGRSIEEIGFIELSNLFRDILLVEGRLFREDLVKLALERLSSSAFRKKNNDHLLLALKCALMNHWGIKMDEDGYVVLEGGEATTGEEGKQ